MIPDKVPILAGTRMRHDEGLLYQVDDVRQSTIGYEASHELGGMVVNYTQLENGDYPLGSRWSKDENGFRAHFTHESEELETVIHLTPEISKNIPSDHRPNRPHRRQLCHAVAEILKRGYTLTTPELREIQTNYGYSSRTNPSDILMSLKFRQMLEIKGVELTSYNYKQDIFMAAGLELDEKDIVETIGEIDGRH
jgi:hypothetical protein